MQLPKGSASLANVAADHNTRWTMSAIQAVRSGGRCTLNATDGRIAIIVDYKDENPPDVDTSQILSHESWKREHTLAKKEKRPPTPSMMETIDTDEGNFPKVASLIPDYTHGLKPVSCRVNPRLLIKLLKAIVDLTDADFVDITIPTIKGNVPIKIMPGEPIKHLYTDVDVTAMIMPMGPG